MKYHISLLYIVYYYVFSFAKIKREMFDIAIQTV